MMLSCFPILKFSVDNLSMTENPKNDFWSQNYMNVSTTKKKMKNNPENRTPPPPKKPLQKQKNLNELCKYYLFP